MEFHFPLMPRMFMAIRMEDRFPIVDILQQTPTIPDNCQWGMFLRNHDELTLEMVTDEERDYMYRVYAQDPQARINLGIRRRLAPLLGNHRRRIELMNGLLFSLPGTPVLYYGDEIGMGDNIYLGDRNGVRTPMQWSADRNAGFSRANPQQLYLPITIDPEYHYEAINVEAQQNNPTLAVVVDETPDCVAQTLPSVRARHAGIPASGESQDSGVSATLSGRVYSRRRQFVTVRAICGTGPRGVQGLQPIEMFGRMVFPRIGDVPYLLTLGPHSFFWFTLETAPTPAEADAARVAGAPTVVVSGPCDQLFQSAYRDKLTPVLVSYIKERRWFRSKARTIRATIIPEVIRFPFGATAAHLVSVSR